MIGSLDSNGTALWEDGVTRLFTSASANLPREHVHSTESTEKLTRHPKHGVCYDTLHVGTSYQTTISFEILE